MVPGVIGMGASLLGGVIGSFGAKKAARRAAREKARLQKKLDTLEENRQEVINPYEDVKSLSSMISNPFANLSVATKAAEMKIDLALFMEFLDMLSHKPINDYNSSTVLIQLIRYNKINN